MKRVTFSVGVIADSSLKRHLLGGAVRGQGYRLATSCDPEQIDQSLFADQKIKIWLVDLEHKACWDPLIDSLLDTTDAVVLIGDEELPTRETPGYPRWERRIGAKLKEVLGAPEQINLDDIADAPVAKVIRLPKVLSPQHHKKTVDLVWVLAASLGGPAAVKEFLDSLPAEVPVAFVLAQHIDGNFQQTLSNALVRNNNFSCEVVTEESRLENGKILVAPVGGEISFTDTGKIEFTGSAWQGPYAPSIDQTIKNVANRFGQNSRAIIFSGMGNDGSIAAPIMAEQGGEIWCQNAESCVVSSQPDSVRETGCVSFNGTPRELAYQLIHHLSARQSVARV